jgi:hypothetical protein
MKPIEMPPDTIFLTNTPSSYIRYDTGYVHRAHYNLRAPLPTDTIYENEFGIILTNVWGDTLMLDKVPDVVHKPLPPYQPQKTAFDSITPHAWLEDPVYYNLSKCQALIEPRPSVSDAFPDNQLGNTIAGSIILFSTAIHIILIALHVIESNAIVRRNMRDHANELQNS